LDTPAEQNDCGEENSAARAVGHGAPSLDAPACADYPPPSANQARHNCGRMCSGFPPPRTPRARRSPNSHSPYARPTVGAPRPARQFLPWEMLKRPLRSQKIPCDRHTERLAPERGAFLLRRRNSLAASVDTYSQLAFALRVDCARAAGGCYAGSALTYHTTAALGVIAAGSEAREDNDATAHRVAVRVQRERIVRHISHSEGKEGLRLKDS